MNTEEIFITGVSGSVGQRLANVLLDRGNEVRGFDILPPKDVLKGYNTFKYIKGDITNFDMLCDSMKGMDIAIHCAALLPNKNYLGKKVYFNVNSMGTVNFLRACYSANVKKAIILSNTGVLKPSRNGTIYDSARYRSGGSPYIESKIMAERMVDELNLKNKINYIILRSSAIYGCGMSYRWDNIFDMARRGRLFVISRGDALYSIIHIDDLIDAILLAISKLDGEISGEKMTITSNEKMSIYEILSCITNYYSTKPPKKIPFFPAFIISILLEYFSRISKSSFFSSITRENILDYRHGLFFDTSKSKNLLGFESKRVYKEEIIKVLKEYN